MLCTELLLYLSDNLILKVTALVGDPLWSHAKGGELFDKYGYCTVSIRILALLEPYIVAEIVLDFEVVLVTAAPHLVSRSVQTLSSPATCSMR
jgi:hypothetical protein